MTDLVLFLSFFKKEKNDFLSSFVLGSVSSPVCSTDAMLTSSAGGVCSPSAADSRPVAGSSGVVISASAKRSASSNSAARLFASLVARFVFIASILLLIVTLLL